MFGVRLHSLLTLGLAFSCLPSGLAGPACAKKFYQAADCVQRCNSKWGWTGKLMGTDPWGVVMQKTESDSATWDSVISQACGSPSPTLSISTLAVPTVDVESTTSSSVWTELVLPSATTFASATMTSSKKIVTISRISSSSTSSRSITATSQISTLHETHATITSTPQVTTTPAKISTSVSVTAPETTTTASSFVQSGVSTPEGTSGGDITSYLLFHNNVRAQHGAQPLTWNANLASKAQEWANGCVFEHSGGSLGAFGENLAAGTGNAYGIQEAIESWTNESKDYDPSNPVPSHFTQVVWKATTQVGCAVQQCDGIFAPSFGKAQFFVCEYSPQGNVIGAFAQNVQA